VNRYVLICRLKAPAYILLTGVIALLAEWHILSWGKAWPLYFILAGLLKLAERAALASMDPMDLPGYSPQGQTPVNAAPQTAQDTTIISPVPENHSGESGR
jgi:hypothetical protein